ncbi:MAG: metallophosphoesterase [Lachnospiraceae bacterium]|nr:metallophosphoesterase [Lachnospiraceae bacterium]
MKKIFIAFLLVVTQLCSLAAAGGLLRKRNERVYAYFEELEPLGDRQPFLWEEEKEAYELVCSEDECRILQLTDLHIGGSEATEREDLLAFGAMYRLIRHSQPDLIVVTGDLVYTKQSKTHSDDNANAFTLLCAFFERVGIPWTYTLGNHDTEGTADAEELLEISAGYEMCLSQQAEPVGGRCNLWIRLCDSQGELFESLYLLDSGDYEADGYGRVSEEQLQWYEEKVREAQAEAGAQTDSMLFFHIPFYEWDWLAEQYRRGSGSVNYYYGRIGETGGVLNCSAKSSGMLERILRLGSTSAVFVGHDHLNDLSLEYEGVRFTYGKSIDFLAYRNIEDYTYQRGATLIAVSADGSREIVPIVLEEIGG